jgi:hypothetical protein
MSPHQVMSAATLLVVIGLAQPEPSHAVTCGTSDPKTKATAKATLEVDPDSVTTVAFKRDIDKQKLLIRFNASGCELPNKAPEPTVDVLPRQNVKNVPEHVLTLSKAVADQPDYSLTFVADPSRFGPGTYGGVVEVRAPFLATARAPISLSRSETNELLLVGLGLLGGAVSLVWFLGLHLAKGATTKIKWWHYAFAFGAAAIAGVLAVETAYRAQDVWSFSENAGSALVAAFTGATTGAMVTALAVLFPEPSSAANDETVRTAKS